MYCSVMSAAVSDVDAVPVSVEADISEGLPVFCMVGFVTSQVREAQDRVRTALRNAGAAMPSGRITINLAPGDIRKDGTRFDLPIAAAILECRGSLPAGFLKGSMIIGELRLDGRVGRINGVLPSVIAARDRGCHTCFLPAENVQEGRVVDNIRIVGIRSLQELISLGQGEDLPEEEMADEAPEPESYDVDFADIRGQEAVKRAALIAAAGFHNLLLSGPPGSGKSMTARRIPTILPPLTKEESLEISKIYSIAGLLPSEHPLMTRRPFRSPHHTITPAALCGGGFYPKPGEVTLAHRGVLFLDELPEMNPAALEMLRQPLEDRQITISRVGGTSVYPASFLLAAAMNPCPCGYLGDSTRCSCSVKEIRAYQARISQAILDRIDLVCVVPAVDYRQLSGGEEGGVSSAEMRRQVLAAVQIQKERYQGSSIVFNSELSVSGIEKFCPLTDEARRMLEAAFRHLGLSARSYHRVIKVSRTIADLEGREIINEADISEALCCRSGDLPEADVPGRSRRHG